MPKIIALLAATLSLATPLFAQDFRVEKVTDGLEIPWAIAFLPNGDILVTERPGRLRIIQNGVLNPTPIATFPQVKFARETGLMGLTLHPDFGQNRWLYLAYTYENRRRAFVKVERFRFQNGVLSEPKTLIDDIPAANYHAGGVLKFGPDHKLYITTGDATEGIFAQDLSRLNGKTLRLNDDGRLPFDNPFVGVVGARPEIFSYGHRSAQGLAFHPQTRQMFQTEHGPTSILDGPGHTLGLIGIGGGGDEINLVEAGQNYGWPLISWDEKRGLMRAPLKQYTPAIAPAGATFVSGKSFPQWKNDFIFANLKGKSLIKITLDGSKVTREQTLLKGEFGRLREVIEAPNGTIYFTTSNRDPYGKAKPPASDAIYCIVPAP